MGKLKTVISHANEWTHPIFKLEKVHLAYFHSIKGSFYSTPTSNLDPFLFYFQCRMLP